MKKGYIKNFEEISISKNRELTLEIIEAGYEAIDTEKVITDSIILEGEILKVQDNIYDLSLYKKIKVVGFGKASCQAAYILEGILGDKISEGAIIGLHKVPCKYIETYAGMHPVPSLENIVGGKRISEIATNMKEDELLIVLVSGGGSALLCYPESECIQGKKLYQNFLKSGQTINEINTIRKHLSLLKGGGLAKAAYPATVIGLIFSDIPGNHFQDVASGPTYKDVTTVHDAKRIIEQFDLGEYDLVETPKEDKFFEKVKNYVLVSNQNALHAMESKAKELDLSVEIISDELYSNVESSLEKIFSAQKENTVILAGGEPSLKVHGKTGLGGRNLHMALSALHMNLVKDHSVFVSFASDGMDNSDSAGAIADKFTVEKFNKLKIDAEEYLDNFDSYSAFLQSRDMIITGTTGSNVSDLMVLLTRYEV